MTKDELWLKHMHNDMYITKAGFLAAIAERDAYVKAEAVKVCEKESKRLSQIGFYNEANSCDNCAAAIEKMEMS